MYFLTILFTTCIFGLSSSFQIFRNDEDSDADSLIEKESTEQGTISGSCPTVSRAGVEWILHAKESDFGWKEDTHRAIIALAVNNWTGVAITERILMEQQLEVKVSEALLKNNSNQIYPNNLALYIHALIAANKNPRNFHNVDLVDYLKQLMQNYSPHPFLYLALCNAKSIEQYHLKILEEYFITREEKSRQSIEYKALAVQSYECAKSLKLEVRQSLINDAQKFLASLQYVDGSFGNAYTTALIVQALHSASNLKWNKTAAINYLKKQSSKEVTMISSYLIQLALNVEKFQFIKDIHPNLQIGPARTKTQSRKIFINYSLRMSLDSDIRHTISFTVPVDYNFFDVMEYCAKIDPKYNFSFYLDKSEKPRIYAISNIPNDAEENLYWRLCHQSHNYYNGTAQSVHKSPMDIKLADNDHFIYMYSYRDCSGKESS